MAETDRGNITFAELFSGIGGFRVGLEDAGMQCVFACEIDNNARKIYEFGFAPFMTPLGHDFPNDIRNVEQLPDCDLLCAGFPCQDVSVANNERKGLDGDKSGLFFEIIRLIQSSHRKPQWFVIENVPGLLNSNKGRDFAVVLFCLQECGYGVSWRILDSQYFGVAQRRRRVYIVGYFGEQCPGEILFESEGGYGDTEEVHKQKTEVAYTLTASTGGVSGKEQQQTLVATVLPMKGGMEPNRVGMLTTGTLTKTMSRCSDYPNSRLAICLTKKQARNGDFERSNIVAGTLNPGAHPGGCNGQDAHSDLLVPQRKGVRRLTPRECERLQGFEDGWTRGVSDSVRYQCLGNAVTTYVPRWIGQRIRKFVEAKKA